VATPLPPIHQILEPPLQQSVRSEVLTTPALSSDYGSLKTL